MTSDKLCSSVIQPSCICKGVARVVEWHPCHNDGSLRGRPVHPFMVCEDKMSGLNLLLASHFSSSRDWTRSPGHAIPLSFFWVELICVVDSTWPHLADCDTSAQLEMPNAWWHASFESSPLGLVLRKAFLDVRAVGSSLTCDLWEGVFQFLLFRGGKDLLLRAGVVVYGLLIDWLID